MIDIHGMLIGLLVNPYKVLSAFARGRRTKNLYHDIFDDEKAMATPVGELKRILHLDKFTSRLRPGFSDTLFFFTGADPGRVVFHCFRNTVTGNYCLHSLYSRGKTVK